MTDQALSDDRLARRHLLGGAALLAGTAGVAFPARPARAATTSDQDIFNFALNFEYLGAELYLHALAGQGLAPADTTGSGSKGTVTAGGPVPFFTPAIGGIAEKLAADELGHVRYIRAQLGAAAIAEPTIDLSPAV